MPQKNKTVVFVSQYPGGADVLCPVVGLLKNQMNIEAYVVACDFAAEILTQKNIDFIDLTSQETKDDFLNGFFASHQPDLIVTDMVGKNANDLHYAASRLAREKGIPLFWILDSWVNYPDRFKDPKDNVPLGLVPDRLAVMNQYAADELIHVGVPEQIITVTGQPAFDQTFAILNRKAEIREKVRSEFGIKEEQKLVVFFSENIEEIYGGDETASDFLGYTQHSAINALVDALERCGSDQHCCLVIKRHPREKEPFQDIILFGEKVRQISSMDFSPLELAAASNINCGMSSIMLVHSYLLQKPTLVIVPGMHPGKELLVLVRANVIQGLTTQQDIDHAVNAALDGQADGLNGKWYVNTGSAAQNVVDEICRMLGE